MNNSTDSIKIVWAGLRGGQPYEWVRYEALSEKDRQNSPMVLEVSPTAPIKEGNFRALYDGNRVIVIHAHRLSPTDKLVREPMVFNEDTLDPYPLMPFLAGTDDHRSMTLYSRAVDALKDLQRLNGTGIHEPRLTTSMLTGLVRRNRDMEPNLREALILTATSLIRVSIHHEDIQLRQYARETLLKASQIDLVAKVPSIAQYRAKYAPTAHAAS